MENILDLYTDYLIVNNGKATATGLSRILNHGISHDKITRMLSQSNFDSKYLWKQVKPLVHEMSRGKDTKYLVIDDSIEEKAYTDESELICWHFDHTFQRTVKGVNFLTALYHTGEVSLPIAVEFVKKDSLVIDKKTGKERRAGSVTKNELFRNMVRICNQNVLFDYILADSWFSSAENMQFIHSNLKKKFIMTLKSNRKIALSKPAKLQGKYQAIETLINEKGTVEIGVEQLDFSLSLTIQRFTNEDGSTGVLYLVTNDFTLDASQIATHYQKRWSVEIYHKSIKSNASFAASPTQTTRTQSNHFMASILAFVKLEVLKFRNNLNHFAMKTRIYVDATKAGLKSLAALSTSKNKFAYY
jgi:hypothetical protein